MAFAFPVDPASSMGHAPSEEIRPPLKRIVIPAALALALMTVAGQAHAACFDLSKSKALEVTGTLSRPTFPGPPNYEDVRQGDAPEPAYILRLREPICVTGDEFVADGQKIDRIHLVDDADKPLLQGFVGQDVYIAGYDAYGGQTAHHRAPLVMGVITASPAAGAATDGITSVQAFYLALEIGDGRSAAKNVVPTKRSSGPLSAGSLSAFYGSLPGPLKLNGVERVGRDRFRARYRFVGRGGKVCNGESIVTVEDVEGLNLISGIRSQTGC